MIKKYLEQGLTYDEIMAKVQAEYDAYKQEQLAAEELNAEIKTLTDSMGQLGGGDMMKVTYDADNDGVRLERNSENGKRSDTLSS